MKKEDIEKEARSYSSIMVGGPRHLSDFYEKEKYEAGFEAGAEWRINSVWHDVNDLPTEEETILGVSEEYGCFICGPVISCFAELVKDVKITKWAYIEDLIPNTNE